MLSCTCFLVAINSITNNIPPSIRSTLYVDDYAIYASGSMPNLLERRIQETINIISNWSKTTGLSMSETKTKSLHICKKKNCPKLAANLSINNTAIENVTEYKFLGLFFDKSATWRPHVTQLKAKCIRRLGILKCLSHHKWGADTGTLLRLYQALIKPKIDYGIEAYFSASESYIRSLNTIQHTAIRIATGAFRSSPIDSLHAITGVKPPYLYRELKLLTYYLRLLINPTHPLHRIALDCEQMDINVALPSASFFSKIVSLKRLYELNFDFIQVESAPNEAPWELNRVTVCDDLWDIKKKRYDAQRLRGIFRDHVRQHEDDNTFFTDGSKTEVGVSFAVSAPTQLLANRIQSSASIFTAELHAIKRVISQFHLNNSITICTDSKSSIQSINRYQHPNPIIQEIQQLIISNENAINLCWVPSHIGVEGNERADAAAREAITSQQEHPVPLPKSDHRNEVRRTLIERWYRNWTLKTDNKLWNIMPRIRKIIPCCNTTREWEIKLIRLRIGHTRATHGFLMEGSNRSYCDDCLVPLTIIHILSECPNFNQERIQVFGRRIPPVRDMLFKHSRVNGDLHKYLNYINFFNKI